MRYSRAAVALLSLTLLAACEQESPTGVNGVERSAGALAPDSEAVVEAELGAGVMRGDHTWSITIENLTPDTGDGGAQVFSPPVLATHRGNGVIYRTNQFASPELAGVAEDALNGPLVDALHGDARVFQVVQGDAVVPPGASATYMVESNRMAGQLSMAFMLVNTNDGFAGLNAVRLPARGEAIYYLQALDAGSELNTELASDIPGPCCGSPGVGTPTHERIALHEGIQGDGDLDVEKWGWTGPVAVLSIERVD